MPRSDSRRAATEELLHRNDGSPGRLNSREIAGPEFGAEDEMKRRAFIKAAGLFVAVPPFLLRPPKIAQVDFTSAELTASLDEFSARIMRPAAEVCYTGKTAEPSRNSVLSPHEVTREAMRILHKHMVKEHGLIELT